MQQKGSFLKGLVTLALTAAIGAGAGFGGSQLQTPQWKAEASFDQPRILELGNYYSLFSTYTFLNGGEGVAYQVVANDKGVLTLTPSSSPKAEQEAINSSYQEFKRNLNSPDQLLAFLTQAESVKRKAQLENQPVALIAQQVAGQFEFKGKTATQADSLSVVSANPEEANQLLSDFIAFTNQQTKQSLNAELIAKWKNLFQQITKTVEIKLGAVQQGNQIAVQDWNGKLNLMRSVQPLDDKLVAYRFVKSPSVPLSPSSPAPLLWAMIGALSGLILGIFYLSARSVKSLTLEE